MQALSLDQEILLKHEKIIGLIDKMDSSIQANLQDKTLNNLIQEVHDDYLGVVVHRNYQQFLSESYDHKLQSKHGDSILLELNSIEEIYKICHLISDRRRDVDSAYTDYVFDPFTYTEEVPKRVKSRLYDLMAVQMFNQMVDKATLSTTPFECESTLNDLYEMQLTHIHLKDRDTKKLESKLKRHDSLEERLQILHEELE